MSVFSTIKSLAIAAAVVLPAVQAGPAARYRSIVERDPPPKLPGCSTPGDRKWQPGKRHLILIIKQPIVDRRCHDMYTMNRTFADYRHSNGL